MAASLQSWILFISVASGMYCVGESSDIPFMTFPPVGTLCPSVVPLQIISNRAASTRMQRELDNITRPAAPPQNGQRTRPKRKAKKDCPPTNDLQDTLTVGISMHGICLHLRYYTHTREREGESARAPHRPVPASKINAPPQVCVCLLETDTDLDGWGAVRGHSEAVKCPARQDLPDESYRLSTPS